MLSLFNTQDIQWKVITGKQLRIPCICRMLKAWRRRGAPATVLSFGIRVLSKQMGLSQCVFTGLSVMSRRRGPRTETDLFCFCIVTIFITFLPLRHIEMHFRNLLPVAANGPTCLLSTIINIHLA